MKTRFISRMIVAMVALLACGVARAQNPHIGDIAELGEGTPPKMEKVTYLGVTAKPVDSTLLAQLNLPEGVGPDRHDRRPQRALSRRSSGE